MSQGRSDFDELQRIYKSMRRWLHMRWEPQGSTAGDSQAPRALSGTTKRDLPGHGWSASREVSLLFPSVLYPPSPLLTFTLEDDMESNCDLCSNYYMTCNLSYTANTWKLSADCQSTHHLLNLSACVILSKAFAPKSHPSLRGYCSFFCSFSPGKEWKPYLWASVGLTSFSSLSPEDSLKFQRLTKVL